MQMKICLLVLLVLIGGCASTVPYSEWTAKEKKLYKYQVALQTIDTLQTGRVVNCQKSSRCLLEEGNPVYGKRPSMEKVLGIKVGTNILIYILLSKENRDRETTLKIINTLTAITVINNQIQINKVL